MGQYEHPRWGIDFGWFAVDALGRAGYFDSAGHGPVPAAVMPHIEELDAAADRLEELPVLGPCAEQPTKPGIFLDWMRPAERGFYAYDWEPWRGPYRRLTVPSRPLLARDLPDPWRTLAQLVEIDVDFSTATTIELRRTGVTVATRP